MMKFTLLATLVLTHAGALAQQTVPVFSNKQDSVAYTQIQSTLQEIFRSNSPSDRKPLDSLIQLQAALRAKIIGYRTVYTPDKNYTPYEDLAQENVEASGITQLSISGEAFKRLPASIYKCSNLQELELVNTSIKRLPGKLKKLQKLENIYVYNNKPRGRMNLGKNTTTKEVVLRGMEARNLPRTYKNFSALERLDLTANIGLNKFPDIYRNTRLQKLNLIGNQVTLMDLSRKKSTIEELNLIGNKVERIPSGIANFPSLKKLVLSNNPLTALDPAIGQLTKLEELAFYNCKLSELPASMANLQNLRQIDLYFNQLSSVNISLTGLKNLEILYLSNNQLTALPEDLGSLTSLQELYISNNKISYLPESTANLNNLRVLRMNNNYFASFPYAILKLKNLENLDLSRNDMQQIPDELKTFEKLQIFALIGNRWEREDEVLQIAKILRSKGTIVHTSIEEGEETENNR
jgi:Leucine-rich repeat (LRR) protein